MKALNFSFPDHIKNLVRRRKKSSVWLGDMSTKYCENEVVFVTAGQANMTRKKLYTAFIERIMVKKINQLTVEDIKGENPDFETHDDLVSFLKKEYCTAIDVDDKVTVIRFSEVIE
jgi:hypothetical protein